MKVAMVDTMVFDALLANESTLGVVLAAIEAGRLELCTTHIQEDQLAAIPDDAKRARVEVIPRKRVATSVMVWGVSKWGMAKWGGSEEYEAIRHGESHIEDAIIAATAATDAHVLVTEDKRLRNRARARLAVAVWDVARLVQWASSDEQSKDSPLRQAGQVLEQAEYVDLERRVQAHGEALNLMYEALRAMADEVRPKQGGPPPGVQC